MARPLVLAAMINHTILLSSGLTAVALWVATFVSVLPEHRSARTIIQNERSASDAIPRTSPHSGSVNSSTWVDLPREVPAPAATSQRQRSHDTSEEEEAWGAKPVSRTFGRASRKAGRSRNTTISHTAARPRYVRRQLFGSPSSLRLRSRGRYKEPIEFSLASRG